MVGASVYYVIYIRFTTQVVCCFSRSPPRISLFLFSLFKASNQKSNAINSIPNQPFFSNSFQMIPRKARNLCPKPLNQCCRVAKTQLARQDSVKPAHKATEFLCFFFLHPAAVTKILVGQSPRKKHT